MRDPLISPTHISRQCWAWTSLFAILLLGFFLGCQPDESPFKFENETLRKQIAKQESLIQSLQDGNQVMQEQINLLNRELREAQGISKVAEAQQSQMATKMEDLVKKNKKLLGQFNWVKKKNSRAQYSVTPARQWRTATGTPLPLDQDRKGSPRSPLPQWVHSPPQFSDG